MTASLWEHLFRPTAGDPAIEQLLRDNILFSDLNARQIRFVSNIVHLRQYRETEFIFRQGETGVGMYIILTGAVTITVSGTKPETQSAVDGIEIATLGPGDFFGELALVEDNSRRSADARALEDTQLIGFFKPDLLDILERNPAAGIRISMRLGQVLGRRLRETTDRLWKLEEQKRQKKRQAAGSAL